MQILLQRRGLSLNPITTMYYIAPASFAFLCVPWAVIEASKLYHDDKASCLPAQRAITGYVGGLWALTWRWSACAGQH